MALLLVPVSARCTAAEIGADDGRLPANQSQFEERLAALTKAAKEKPSGFVPLLQFADALGSARQHGNAARAYESLVGVRSDPAFYLKWLTALRHGGARQKAIVVCEEFRRKFPGQVKHHAVELIEVYRSAGKIQEAVALARQYLELDRQSAQRHTLLTDLLIRAKEYGPALEALQQAASSVETEFDRYPFDRSICRIYERQEKVDEAIRHAQSMAESYAEYILKNRSVGLLIRLLRKAKRTEAFVQALEAKAAANPKDRVTWDLVARIHSQTGKHEKAIDAFKALIAIEEKPAYYSAWVHALGHLRKYDEQIALHEDVLKKFPKHRAHHLPWLMKSYQLAGRKDEAIRIGKEYVELSKQSSAAFEKLAHLYHQLKQFDESAKAYQQAVAKEKEVRRREKLSLKIVTVYRDKGDLAAAEAHARECVKSFKDEYRRRTATRLLDEILKTTGKEDTRIVALERRLKEAPSDESVRHELASIYSTRDDYEKVSEYCREIVRLNPTARNYETWIRLLTRDKKHERAISVYEEMFQELPAQRHTHLQMLVLACRRAGRMDDAIRLAEGYAKDYQQDGSATAQYATILQRAGRHKDAIRAFRKAISLEPGSPSQWHWEYQIAEMQHGLGQTDEAIKLSRKLSETASGKGQKTLVKRLEARLGNAPGSVDERIAAQRKAIEKAKSRRGKMKHRLLLAKALIESKKLEEARTVLDTIIRGARGKGIRNKARKMRSELP